MRITEAFRARLEKTLFVLLLCLMTACGSSTSPSATSEPAAVPAELVAALQRDDIEVVSTTFGDSEIDAATAQEVFSKVYDASMFEQAPTPYSVTIQRSSETRLSPGSTAWMLHVGNVEQEVARPALPGEAEEPPPITIQTDMFAFIEPRTGQHLATVYVGPDSGS